MTSLTLKARQKHRRLPQVDVPIIDANDELRRFSESIKEHLRMYEGDSGAPKERFVTIEELEHVGLVTTKVQQGFASIDKLFGQQIAAVPSATPAAGAPGGGGGGGGVRTLKALDDTRVDGIKGGEGIVWNGSFFVPRELPNFKLTDATRYDMLFFDGEDWIHTDQELQWNPTDDYMQFANDHSINWLNTAGATRDFVNFAEFGVGGGDTVVGHIIAKMVAGVTTTSGTYVDVTGATVAYASMEANEDYAVFVRGYTGNSSSTSTAGNGIHITKGGSLVPGSEQLYESPSAVIDDYGMVYAWGGIVNSGASGDLQVQHKSGNGADTIFTNDVTIMMIKVDDLTLNTNVFHDTNSGLVELDDGNFPPTSWFDTGAAVTIGDGVSDYLVFGTCQVNGFLSGGNTVSVRINDGSSPLTGNVTVRGDGSDQLLLSFMQLWQVPAETTTLTVEAIGTGFPVDKIFASIVAIRMDAFVDYQSAFIATSPDLGDGPNDIVTVAFTTSGAEDYGFLTGASGPDSSSTGAANYIRNSLNGGGDTTIGGSATQLGAQNSTPSGAVVPHWNVSADQALGAGDTVNADFVGVDALTPIEWENCFMLVFQWALGEATDQFFDVGNVAYTTRNKGKTTRFYDPGLTDYVEFDHDDTDFNVAGFQTTDLNFTGFTAINQAGNLNVTGTFTVLDSTEADSMAVAHDGTKLDFTFTNCNEVKFTGVTASYVFDRTVAITPSVAGQGYYVYDPTAPAANNYKVFEMSMTGAGAAMYRLHGMPLVRVDTDLDVTGDFTVDTDVFFVDDVNNFIGIGTASSTTTEQLSLLMAATKDILIDGATNPREIDTGVMRFEQIPSIPDTRCITFNVNATDQEGTHAAVVNLTADLIEAGETISAYDVNVDSGTATGGIARAFEVSLAGNGSLEVHALHVDPGVWPLMQHSGVFINVEQAFDNNGGWSDVTAAFNDAGTDVQIFSADDDYIYIGMAAIFDQIEVTLAIVATNPGIKPTFEYSEGAASWAVFTPTDETQGFRQSGVINWGEALAGWATDTVNAVANKYWIRIRRTTPVAITPPTEDTIQVAATVMYSWDESGDIVANTITAASFSGAAFEVVGAAQDDLLYLNGAGFWTDTGGKLTWSTTQLWIDGSIHAQGAATFDGTLTVRDAGQTDWLAAGHDGADFNFDFTNTVAVNFTGATGSYTFGSAIKLEYGAPKLLFIEDDAAVNNTLWDIVVETERMRFRVRADDDATGADWLLVDRTLNTVDALTFAATSFVFTGALTATSYGGITEANLLDKTATESVEASWTFLGANFTLSNDAGPLFHIKDSNAALDEKDWTMVSTGGLFALQTRFDNGNFSENVILIDRTGEVVASIVIDVPTITLTGAVTGTSFGGITEANLVDKTAGEDISAQWRFIKARDATYPDLIGFVDIMSTDAQAAGIGGVLSFGGKYLDAGNYTTFGSLRTSKANATSGNYASKMILGARTHGGTPMKEMSLDGETGDVSAISFGGITEANLLDKTAGETITAAWIFSTLNSHLRLRGTGNADPLDTTYFDRNAGNVLRLLNYDDSTTTFTTMMNITEAFAVTWPDVTSFDVSSFITTSGADTSPAAGKSALSANMLHIDGKEAIDGSDTYLRLNQNGDFGGGVFVNSRFEQAAANDFYVKGSFFGTGAGLVSGNWRYSTDLYVGAASASAVTNVFISAASGMSIRSGATSGGWARGIVPTKNSDSTRMGGAGFLGSNETITSFHIGFGSTWWGADSVLDMTSATITPKVKVNFDDINILSGFVAGVLTGSVNNYNPTGADTTPILTITADGNYNMTGLVPTNTGRVLHLLNQDSNNTLTLIHESGSSSATNRFLCPGNVDYVMPVRSGVTLFYTSSRWYILGSVA